MTERETAFIKEFGEDILALYGIEGSMVERSYLDVDVLSGRVRVFADVILENGDESTIIHASAPSWAPNGDYAALVNDIAAALEHSFDMDEEYVQERLKNVGVLP